MFLANTDCEIMFVLRLICKSLGSQWGLQKGSVFLSGAETTHRKPGQPALRTPLRPSLRLYFLPAARLGLRSPGC